MKEPLQQTLIDAIDLLQSRAIPYALVGGLAASIRGRIRVTEDVDFVALCTTDQAIEMAGSLRGTKFEPMFPEIEEVIRRSFLLPLRHRDTGLTIDLAIGISGFEQQVVQRATALQIADREVTVATAEDLLLMKLLAGRPQDDQDIRGIVAVHRKELDWDYCEAIARQLQEAVSVDLVVRVEKLRRSDS